MNFWRILLPVGLLLAPFIARGGGDEVVVIYNSQLPESKAVAEHYAAARAVIFAQMVDTTVRAQSSGHAIPWDFVRRMGSQERPYRLERPRARAQ